MLKSVRRSLLYFALILMAAGGVAWFFDGIALRFRSSPWSNVRVDSMYAVKNRWNEIEYSVGSTGTERCVRALFPHAGYRPCWYVTSHAMKYIRIG